MLKRRSEEKEGCWMCADCGKCFEETRKFLDTLPIRRVFDKDDMGRMPVCNEFVPLKAESGE